MEDDLLDGSHDGQLVVGAAGKGALRLVDADDADAAADGDGDGDGAGQAIHLVSQLVINTRTHDALSPLCFQTATPAYPARAAATPAGRGRTLPPPWHGAAIHRAPAAAADVIVLCPATRQRISRQRTLHTVPAPIAALACATARGCPFQSHRPLQPRDGALALAPIASLAARPFRGCEAAGHRPHAATPADCPLPSAGGVGGSELGSRAAANRVPPVPVGQSPSPSLGRLRTEVGAGHLPGRTARAAHAESTHSTCPAPSLKPERTLRLWH